MKVVIRDFNAKIGRELFISSNAGLHSLYKETNKNGQRLWDFAVSENLFIISTAFPHKEIHEYTWISPDGQTHNQIYHVLIDRRHRNNIMDRENSNYKPDTSKLMEKNILKEYKLKLSAGIISELDSSGNDFNWKSVKEIILKSADETVPGLERRARNECIPSELLKVDEPELVNALHKIMVKIWETEKFPLNGKKALSAPFLKKETNLCECRNYRGITLLNTAYKIFSNLLFARLQLYTDKVIGNYQRGFRPQGSTIDQIHTLRQILEKT
ncbi:uncharacterized protein TNCV_2183771 [Trichonephila clavipes]|nr:uncharacterized protein TNCV_2183771 [Trichonephila clavipes]